MKKILILLFFIIVSKTTFAQAFVTTWNTGTYNYIIIPGYGTNYNIQWEEIGNPSHNGTKTATNIDTVKFGTAGTYKVSISGGSPAFNRINMGRIYDKNIFPIFNPFPKQLQSVEDWGSIHWSSMDSAFSFCSNLISVPLSIPDLSGVSSLSKMFSDAYAFNQPIGNWNTSNISNMSSMFSNAYAFNQPISNWNTSNVTNMQGMFNGAKVFNQPIGNWNTSNVTNMSSMFSNAYAFNQPIGNWNTSNVTNMHGMFFMSYAFNQPIGNWNTSNVTNMISMFNNAYAFNQPIGNWNTGNVLYMESMFNYDTSFNQPIGNWNTANVLIMDYMFKNATKFNQPLGSWNTGSVSGMYGMFDGAISFNQPISNWSTKNVQLMSFMFSNARSFNQPIGNWNTDNVFAMVGIFAGAASFNQNIGSWNITRCAVRGVYAGIGLDYSGMKYNNYDSTIIGWSSQSINNLTITATNLNYCNSVNQRTNAIITKGWQFNGDSYGCILPIHLTYFTATTQQSKVLLQWQTATETNNNYFIVQRSSNKDNWQTLATVKGAGNSSIANNYATTDIDPLQGISYYRIQQTDFNGSVSYSEVRKIIINNKSQTVNIYPNPAKNIVNINSIESGLLNVYNTLGKLVLCQNISKGNNTILLSSLSNGVYVFKIIGSKSQFYKVIKD